MLCHFFHVFFLLHQNILAADRGSVVVCDLTVQQSGGNRMVETITAVAAVAAGNLIIIRPLQGQIRGGSLLELPLQDPTHHVVPPTGYTCTKYRGKVYG